jgi:osmotically-inducible protein OsmY
VAEKLVQWHLTPEDIKKDLSGSGEVVRTKAKAAGHSIADATLNAKIKTFINAKYAFDSELSARAIDVECTQGHVTLRGTAPSETLIGKAVALALETDGVIDVKSLLVVKP